MVRRVRTLAFEGIEARPVDVQVHVLGGNPVITIEFQGFDLAR